MDQREYYRESLRLQEKQVRATEGRENWLQTLLNSLFIVAIAVAYVVICIVLLAIRYWYIWIPAVIVIAVVTRMIRRGRRGPPKVINPMFRPSVSMEYMKKEFAGTEFADIYEPKGRGCKEPR